MTQVVKIGCPKCGAVLSVQAVQGIDTKHVTCPICKNKGLFTTFRRIDDKPDESKTQIPETLIRSSEDSPTIGALTINGKRYPLHQGRNVIGRQAAGNNADIQIPANVATKRMSRQHIVIDVRQLSNGCYRHELSLYKPEVNPTYLNNDKISYGDTFLLTNNQTIKLPDCAAIFTAAASDATMYDEGNTTY